jgi:hypothetical protein
MTQQVHSAQFPYRSKRKAPQGRVAVAERIDQRTSGVLAMRTARRYP